MASFGISPQEYKSILYPLAALLGGSIAFSAGVKWFLLNTKVCCNALIENKPAPKYAYCDLYEYELPATLCSVIGKVHGDDHLNHH